MSGLFHMSSMTATVANARNKKARKKKNHASGEFGMKYPHAGLLLGT
jgi:hypothetical protein